MLGQILSTERDAGRLAKHGDNQFPEGGDEGEPPVEVADLVTIGVTKRLSARAAKLAEPEAV